MSRRLGAGFFISILDALCLTYPQDIAAANALFNAKALFDVSLDTNSSLDDSMKYIMISIGSFSTALFIPDTVPYMNNDCVSGGYAIYIIPNMIRRGITVLHNGVPTSSYMSSSPTGSYIDTSIESTEAAVIFRYRGGSSTSSKRLRGIIAVLS